VELEWHEIKRVSVERKLRKLRNYVRLRIEAKDRAYMSLWTNEGEPVKRAHEMLRARVGE